MVIELDKRIIVFISLCIIDTASAYKNEEDFGKSLKTLLPKYGLKRSDIFITSKLGECRKYCQ